MSVIIARDLEPIYRSQAPTTGQPPDLLYQSEENRYRYTVLGNQCLRCFLSVQVGNIDCKNMNIVSVTLPTGFHCEALCGSPGRRYLRYLRYQFLTPG